MGIFDKPVPHVAVGVIHDLLAHPHAEPVGAPEMARLVVHMAKQATGDWQKAVEQVERAIQGADVTPGAKAVLAGFKRRVQGDQAQDAKLNEQQVLFATLLQGVVGDGVGAALLGDDGALPDNFAHLVQGAVEGDLGDQIKELTRGQLNLPTYLKSLLHDLDES